MRRDEQEMELATPVRHESPAVPPEGRVTDGDLLQRIADGDNAAFDILYRRFARPLYGLALRMLRDRGRAEDAVQETFAVDLALRRAATGPSAARARRGSTPSRGTRSSTARAPAARRPSPIRPRASARRRAGRAARSPATSPGACTARSRTCPSTSARCSSSPTGAGSRRARSREFLDIPLGTVKTRTRSGLARLADLLEGEFR